MRHTLRPIEHLHLQLELQIPVWLTWQLELLNAGMLLVLLCYCIRCAHTRHSPIKQTQSANCIHHSSFYHLCQVQDSAARFMAIVSSSSQPAVLHIAKGTGVSLLLHLLAAPRSSSTALGNASLCLGELAKHQELLPILSRQDAVAPLLGMILEHSALLMSSGTSV